MSDPHYPGGITQYLMYQALTNTAYWAVQSEAIRVTRSDPSYLIISEFSLEYDAIARLAGGRPERVIPKDYRIKAGKGGKRQMDQWGNYQLNSAQRWTKMKRMKRLQFLFTRWLCAFGEHGKPVGGIESMLFIEYGLRYFRYHTYWKCPRCGAELELTDEESRKCSAELNESAIAMANEMKRQRENVA